MDLSIIIVTYKAKDKLRVTLDAVFASQTSYSYEVIVVDNASEDGTLEMLQEEFLFVENGRDNALERFRTSTPVSTGRAGGPSDKALSAPVFLIKNSNEGFSKANNRGIAQAKGEYILILNPDTKVSPDTLEIMLDFMKSRPEVGIATCKLVAADGSLDLACRRSFPNPASAFYRFSGLSLLFPHSKKIASYNRTYEDDNRDMEIDACNGAFMLISPACRKAIKGFDEDFFMYDEDIDLCLRAHEAGFKVWYYPKTTTVHFKGQPYKSSQHSLKVFHQSKWIYYKKHLAKNYPGIFNGLIFLAIWLHYGLKSIQNFFR